MTKKDHKKGEEQMEIAQMDQFLTEIEVAQLIGRSRSALQKDRFKRIGIPFIKMGRSIRYRAQDIKNFMHDHRVKTN